MGFKCCLTHVEEARYVRGFSLINFLGGCANHDAYLFAILQMAARFTCAIRRTSQWCI